jgi:hypothetical protein
MNGQLYKQPWLASAVSFALITFFFPESLTVNHQASQPSE